ncbi:MAG: hypothetical protein NC913_03235 [Candidatus Omnitrophica bacterium]|nr:hypothetical protein [Candidatus Omnitrophota bacterium]
MHIKIRKEKFVGLTFNIILLSLLFMPFFLYAGTKPVTKDYKLTLKAENLTLTDLARSLNNLGIDVFIDRAEKDRIINVEIKEMPLEKAIKMLAYPLNYAIVFNEKGEVKELRIFKTSISPAKGYVAFESTNKENRDKDKTGISTSSNSPATPTSFKTAMSVKNYEKDKKDTKGTAEETTKLILEPTTLGGETAYAYNIWLNKRLAEMNNIAEQQRMNAEREMETKKPNLTQNLNYMAKANMQLTMAQQASAQSITGDGSQKDTKSIETFYNYTNELNKIMEAKRTQEIIEAQKKNFANYMYYQQKAQTGNFSNPYAAYQSYYQTMSLYKTLYGKK